MRQTRSIFLKRDYKGLHNRITFLVGLAFFRELADDNQQVRKISTNKHFYGTSISRTLMDSLESIFSIQKELASMIDLSRYPDSVDGRVSALSTAIVHEAIELQRLTNWKWWKKPTPFDTNAAKEELIDIWHFVVQASIELGMTPGDVVNEYKKKNKINRERQTSGY